ncbi:alpha/beta fold hydrolase [Flavobacterium jejuense]|uniref:Alpha/beta fold hydrolase n=1 Tax=Flavobacterium jejuense TaxID=1544455 RepID=A0ABX0IQC4_9FLAO|nr:alpha/beta fold hydrolase [Flavobacterium jejuense]NHN25758.1 alpha/beta fold hydrolase [Flavobacterium jejuense]
MKNFTLLLLFFLNFGFTQTEEVILRDNSNLHYKTFGSGKPILIINGGPGINCEGFGYLAEELAKKNFKTIIYDQRGTGKSTISKANSETITMDLMVSDIEYLRKHLKIDKWIILGHSFGGIMASYYATQHPETIEKLIFSSSGGVNMKFTNTIQEHLNNNLTQNQRDSLTYYSRKISNGDSSEETAKLRAKYLAYAYVYDKSKAEIIAERLTETNLHINSLVFADLRRINFDCTNSFKNFKQPVLVLQGKNDIISIETATDITKAFPNSKLILMDKCAHYGWLDANELYFNSINNFLKN